MPSTSILYTSIFHHTNSYNYNDIIEIPKGNYINLDDFNRINTGWWAFNKVLNYLIIDQTVALPLIVIGYVLHKSASDD